MGQDLRSHGVAPILDFMPILMPIASGKGGVGKSVVAANLAFQLSRLGKTVILADMDWGGSNAHTLLGLKANQAGVGEFISNKDSHLDSLVVPLAEPHLFFLPGDGLIPGTANMRYFRKVRLIKELKELTSDYVILDLGAGTHFNTIDLFLACGRGFVITSPEPTAILNAYGFIKTALYRLLHSSLPSKHPGRAIIQDFFNNRLDRAITPPSISTKGGMSVLYEQIDHLDPSAATRLKEIQARFYPRIIVNMGKEIQELTLGGRLRQVCTRHLELPIEYSAFIPWDDGVRDSIMARTLIGRSNPSSPFSKAISNLARKLCTSHLTETRVPIEDFSDLKALAEETETE